MLKESFKSTLVKYLCLSAALIIISPAQVNGLHPFGMAAYTALVFAGCSAPLLALPLIAGSFIGNPDWIGAAATALGAGIIIAADYLMARKKRSYGIVIMICLCIT